MKKVLKMITKKADKTKKKVLKTKKKIIEKSKVFTVSIVTTGVLAFCAFSMIALPQIINQMDQSITTVLGTSTKK